MVEDADLQRAGSPVTLPPDRKTAVVLFAHGSPVESANQAVREVARAAAAQGGFARWEAAFLGNGRPDLAGAVANLASAGAARVLIIPYFLTLGLHMQRDLPLLINEVSRLFPSIEMVCGEPLEGHPGLVEILAERARQALEQGAPG